MTTKLVFHIDLQMILEGPSKKNKNKQIKNKPCNILNLF